MKCLASCLRDQRPKRVANHANAHPNLRPGGVKFQTSTAPFTVRRTGLKFDTTRVISREDAPLTDLLAHVSLGSSEMPIEPVDLADIAKQVLGDLHAEIERQQAFTDISGIYGSVMANPASLNLIVINLFSNALKFVPRGRAPEVKAWTETRDGFVRLWVQDNGIGISSEHINKLFAIFQRLHTREEFPGTGIGLAIVKRASERMGGRVGVESEEGRGSRFWVELKEHQKLGAR